MKLTNENSSWRREIISKMAGFVSGETTTGMKKAVIATAVENILLHTDNSYSLLSAAEIDNLWKIVHRLDREIDGHIRSVINDGTFELKSEEGGWYPYVARNDRRVHSW